MSLLSHRALVAALLFSVGGLQACDACSSKKEEPSAQADAKQAKKKKKSRKKTKPKVSSGHAPRSGVSVAIQTGDRALLWTEGRTSSLGRKVSDLSWSSEGFEWGYKGGTQVLAPGGALYWRTNAATDARPLAELLAAPGPVPEGYEVKAGAGRGGQYKLTLNAPGSRSFRLGMSKEAPSATAWLDGQLPAGVRPTAELDKTVTWTRDDAGRLVHALPAGLTAVEAAAAPAEKSAAWTTDLQKLAGASAQMGPAVMVELDGDEAPEALACLSGASGDFSCWVVDEVAGATHYHAIGIPWKGGDVPLVGKQADNTYVVWVGPPARSKEGADPIGHVAYFDGGAFQVELVR